MRNKGRALLALGLMLACVLGAGRSLAYTGRVIDGSTGKPAVGVYVMGRWETGGGFIVPSSGCTLAVTRSDDKGDFTLSGADGLLGAFFGPSGRPMVFFYKRGYARTNAVPEEVAPWVIAPDGASTDERLARLAQLQGWTDCGVDEVTRRKAELIPLYRAMIDEASDIAKTREEKLKASRLSFWLDVLELGVDAAHEKSRMRWQSERGLQ